jgi:hypothetical protein
MVIQWFPWQYIGDLLPVFTGRVAHDQSIAIP